MKVSYLWLTTIPILCPHPPPQPWPARTAGPQESSRSAASIPPPIPEDSPISCQTEMPFRLVDYKFVTSGNIPCGYLNFEDNSCDKLDLHIMRLLDLLQPCIWYGAMEKAPISCIVLPTPVTKNIWRRDGSNPFPTRRQAPSKEPKVLFSAGGVLRMSLLEHGWALPC